MEKKGDRRAKANKTLEEHMRIRRKEMFFVLSVIAEIMFLNRPDFSEHKLCHWVLFLYSLSSSSFNLSLSPLFFSLSPSQ